jgi:DNA-binding NtrC family response regulator
MAHILLIDDDKDVLDALGGVLGDAGHNVEGALSGRSAMAKFQTGKFEVAISDIFMPDQDGIGTIRYIRMHDPRIGIIAISGGGQTGDPTSVLRMSAELGADFTLAKPIRVDTLLDTVAMAEGRYRRRIAPGAPHR